MEERLSHDPRTKQTIKDTLYHHLYDPVLQQFNARLEQIVVRNAVMLGSAYHSFSYKGEKYSTGTGALPRRMDRLHKSLYPVMDEYLTDIKALNDHEVPHVLGYINQVLNNSNELHDYLKMLPASIHRPIEELIATYPCRTVGLSTESIQSLKERNQSAIDLVKYRLMVNLLI